MPFVPRATSLTAFVQTPPQLYGARFLLGAAEAGFFPGIILYLTYWYPAEYRARFLAAFAIAVPVSSVIGGMLGAYALSNIDAIVVANSAVRMLTPSPLLAGPSCRRSF